MPSDAIPIITRDDATKFLEIDIKSAAISDTIR
jgi:hypothetical protein